jgi:hypothetical protein
MKKLDDGPEDDLRGEPDNEPEGSFKGAVERSRRIMLLFLHAAAKCRVLIETLDPAVFI